jgi:hypothetical protein
VAHTHIVVVVVKYKLRVMLVNGVVGEVHVLFVQVGVGRLDVLLSGKTGQTLVEHVESHRISSA